MVIQILPSIGTKSWMMLHYGGDGRIYGFPEYLAGGPQSDGDLELH
jgi:hypothetical protein